VVADSFIVFKDGGSDLGAVDGERGIDRLQCTHAGASQREDDDDLLLIFRAKRYRAACWWADSLGCVAGLQRQLSSLYLFFLLLILSFLFYLFSVF
jgi:hypothetical protein